MKFGDRVRTNQLWIETKKRKPLVGTIVTKRRHSPSYERVQWDSLKELQSINRRFLEVIEDSVPPSASD